MTPMLEDLTKSQLRYNNLKFSPLKISRKKELEVFQKIIKNKESVILSIFGHPGTGKSELLMHYRITAKEEGIAFYLVNANFTKDDPTSFLHALLEQMGPPSTSVSPLEAIRMHIQHLEKKGKRFVIAIDSFEHFEKLDEWFRQSFLPSLPSSSIIIFCGRQPLNIYWKSSIWHTFIKTINLQALTLNQLEATIETPTANTLQSIWHYSKGNPYAISLLISSLNNYGELNDRQIHGAFRKLIREWLREVKDEAMITYIEAASFGVQFNQEKLEDILQTSLARKEFERLISYSFIEETASGWKLNPLFQFALKTDLRIKKPTYYHELWKRALLHCRTHIEKHDQVIGKAEVSEFFHLLKERIVHSSPFHNESISLYKLTSAEENDWAHIEPFLTRGKKDFSKDSYLTKEMLEEIGLQYVKLLRNQEGKVSALAVLIPIAASTLDTLKNSDVTRSYFTNLSRADEKRIDCAKQPCGWVIRYLGLRDRNQKEVLYTLLYHLLPLVLTEGTLVASTPVSQYQELLEQFRFKEVPEAQHNDYGDGITSKTYELDLKNNRLPQYLDYFAKAIGVTIQEVPLDRFQFTPREKEVANLVIQGKSNAQIASELTLTEITVKKHLTRIYGKLDVKNRTELTKVILGGGLTNND